MSQTGTPTEFLKLGITEPDDTLNVLVDLNGQWQKIDTGVKNVDTKANTNASGISALNTAVQDNTENITNILETNVNQQNSIDTLQSKVATLEQDDTSYGTRITAVEAGVQENSELINDLEVDLSGVKTSIGTVPSGSNLQGEVSGLDTRVTALENSGSVAAVEARVTTLETEVGTVPAGETVQGQITTLNGQVNSGNIPFRFSVDGGGNYGYLKADDSFVPFSLGDAHWHMLDVNYTFSEEPHSFIVIPSEFNNNSSPNYRKVHDTINDIEYTIPGTHPITIIGNIVIQYMEGFYLLSNGNVTAISDDVIGVIFSNNTRRTHYLTKNGYNLRYKVVDASGNAYQQTVDFTVRGLSNNSPSVFEEGAFLYVYNDVSYRVTLKTSTGLANETEDQYCHMPDETLRYMHTVNYLLSKPQYNIKTNTYYNSVLGKTVFNPIPDGEFFYKVSNKRYYYV